MTWTGPEGQQHFKRPKWGGGRKKRHKERRRRIEGEESDKKREVGEIKFGERVFIKKAKGDRESQRDTNKDRDRQMETEEFTRGGWEKETLKRDPGREEFFSSFHQAVKLFLFLAHFPDCKTLSIGQPYEVAIWDSVKPTEASPPQNMVKLCSMIKY